MATGAAVVSTKVGGIADVIDEGVSGFLVAPGDDEAMRSKLEELASDRSLAAAVGEDARSTVQESYSAERMAREYLELYQRELAARF